MQSQINGILNATLLLCLIISINSVVLIVMNQHHINIHAMWTRMWWTIYNHPVSVSPAMSNTTESIVVLNSVISGNTNLLSSSRCPMGYGDTVQLICFRMHKLMS